MGAIVCLYHSYHGIGLDMATFQTSSPSPQTSSLSPPTSSPSSSSSSSPSSSCCYCPSSLSTTSMPLTLRTIVIITNKIVFTVKNTKLAESVKSLSLTLVGPCGASRSVQISVTAILLIQCIVYNIIQPEV